MLKILKAICWLRRGIKWVESLIDDDLKEKKNFHDGSQKKVTESVTEVKKKNIENNNCAINHEFQFFSFILTSFYHLFCTFRYIHGKKDICLIYKQFFLSFFLLSSALPEPETYINIFFCIFLIFMMKNFSFVKKAFKGSRSQRCCLRFSNIIECLAFLRVLSSS